MAYLPVIARVSATRIGVQPFYGSLGNLPGSCWPRPVARRPIGLSSGSLATVTFYIGLAGIAFLLHRHEFLLVELHRADAHC